MQTSLIKCVLCNSNDYSTMLTTTDIRYKTTTRNFSLTRCNKCGLVTVSPQLSESEIRNFYTEDYWKDGEKNDLMKRLFEKFTCLEKIYTLTNYKSGGRILDLGCGTGNFLNHLRERGWSCFGVDISHSACCKARILDSDLKICDKRLVDCNFPDSFFDVIISNHSFNYLMNPNSELYEIRRILKDQGILTLYMPNIECAQFRVKGDKWFGLDIPRQCYHYSPRTIRTILMKNGFSIVKLNYPLWDSLTDLHYHYMPRIFCQKVLSPIYFATTLVSLCFKILAPSWRGTMEIIADKSKCN